jgi:hypothetical protein
MLEARDVAYGEVTHRTRRPRNLTEERAVGERGTVLGRSGCIMYAAPSHSMCTLADTHNTDRISVSSP